MQIFLKYFVSFPAFYTKNAEHNLIFSLKEKTQPRCGTKLKSVGFQIHILTEKSFYKILTYEIDKNKRWSGRWDVAESDPLDFPGTTQNPKTPGIIIVNYWCHIVTLSKAAEDCSILSYLKLWSKIAVIFKNLNVFYGALLNVSTHFLLPITAGPCIRSLLQPPSPNTCDFCSLGNQNYQSP